VHNKTLTADNLERRGWPHHDVCVMCNGPLKTGCHLSLQCLFAQAVWNQVMSWELFDVELPAPSDGSLQISSWREDASGRIPRDKRRAFNGTVIYVMWNIWKECSRRIFDDRFQTAQQVAAKVREDILQYKRARRIVCFQCFPFFLSMLRV